MNQIKSNQTKRNLIDSVHAETHNQLQLNLHNATNYSISLKWNSQLSTVKFAMFAHSSKRNINNNYLLEKKYLLKWRLFIQQFNNPTKQINVLFYDQILPSILFNKKLIPSLGFCAVNVFELCMHRNRTRQALYLKPDYSAKMRWFFFSRLFFSVSIYWQNGNELNDF